MTSITELSNHQIVTIVVALLGGISNHVDREDIAIRANELVTGKFNWRRYPNRIDLSTIQIALNDAKKSKNGALLVGNNSRGWMLGPNGVSWLRYIITHQKIEEFPEPQIITSIENLLETERKRLLSSHAYQLFIQGKAKDIILSDFYDFVHVNEYFQAKARERRYTIIKNSIMGDQILEDLWAYLQGKYITKG